ADEQMPERILDLALHRARESGTDEFLSGELVQCKLDFGVVATGDLDERSRPKDLPYHCGILQQALAFGRKRVETRGNQRVHAVREEGSVRGHTSVRKQANELLRIKRITACAFQNAALGFPTQHRPLDQVRDE